MKMPLGKYKGRPIEDVPDDYIRWLLESNLRVTAALAEELENQLKLREGLGVRRRG